MKTLDALMSALCRRTVTATDKLHAIFNSSVRRTAAAQSVKSSQVKVDWSGLALNADEPSFFLVFAS
jgi:hypothetical protein